jgi:hypothetical protein
MLTGQAVAAQAVQVTTAITMQNAVLQVQDKAGREL